MTRGQKRLRATLALMGTTIGAGVFGVAAMIGAWGVIPATIGFAILAIVVLTTQLLYAEAVLKYHPPARLSGFAEYWLGPVTGAIAGIAQTLQVFGSNLAYLILGGEFLAIIATAFGLSLPVLIWQSIFWIGGALTVLAGLQWVAKVEAFLVWIKISVMILIIGVLTGRLDFDLITAIPTTWTLEPYGVFLFALFGLSVIPEMEELVSERRDDLRKSVMRGTIASAALTYVFGLSAWLASSGTLGRDAMDLLGIMPPGLALIVPIFGFLAVITAYLTSAYDLGSMFRLDFHFPRSLAWLASLGVPFALLFLTARDYLSTIGLVGSVFGATTAVIAALMGRAALRRKGKVRTWSGAWWWREVTPLAVTAFFVIGGCTWFFT